jgi:hypothetical protein
LGLLLTVRLESVCQAAFYDTNSCGGHRPHTLGVPRLNKRSFPLSIPCLLSSQTSRVHRYSNYWLSITAVDTSSIPTNIHASRHVFQHYMFFVFIFIITKFNGPFSSFKQARSEGNNGSGRRGLGHLQCIALRPFPTVVLNDGTEGVECFTLCCCFIR